MPHARCGWIVAILLSHQPSETISSCHTNYETKQVRRYSDYYYDNNFVDEVISATATCNYSSLYNPKHYEISPSYEEYERWNENAERTLTVSVMSSYIAKYQGDIFKFSSSAKLLKIALVDCNVQEIDVGSFTSLKALKEITFESNNITEVYNGTFSELNDLEVLSLARNNISKFEEGVFDDLESLKLLNLSHNLLSVLEEEVFSSLEKLEKLDLSWNHITSVEDTLHIPSLKSLDLNHNDIVRVSNATFKFLIQLEVLSLSGNKISELPLGMVNHLDTLVKLNLSENRLKVINFTSLVGLKSLKVLDISNNVIIDISSHAFYSTPKLEVLRLSNNSVVDVDELVNIKSLRSIDFDGNSIKCTTLLRTIYLLEQRGVEVRKGVSSEEVNIHGIACHEVREDKTECTDGNQISVIEEYLLKSDERVEKMLKGHFTKLEIAFLTKLEDKLKGLSLKEIAVVESTKAPPVEEIRSVDTAKAENLNQEQDKILEVSVKQLNTLSLIFVPLLVISIGLLLVVLLLVSRKFFTMKKDIHPDNLTEMEEIA